MHVNLGGYHISDVEISAAIDVDANKVGKDVSEAIGTWPNNTVMFAKVPKMGVKVQRGMTHDGLGKYLSQIIKKAPGSTVDIVKLLKDTKTDVVVNYLPVGSEEATKWYVEQVLEAGCAFVNCIPVFIAREPYWQQRFEKKGLPVIGDDIKSQVGATITHRVLANLFVDRGVRIDRTYQLNFGGNTDFMNMLERERLESKKISKTSGRHEQHPVRPAGRGRARRSVGLRAVAQGSQVVPHPHGGHDVRRCAAQPRDEARGVGLAQLGRHRDRRRALRQDRSRQGSEGCAHRAVVVLQEVAAGADPG
jgi:myo-inositol-1-phosphate synthase